MERHTIHIQAGQLASLQGAFASIKGPRPLMLSYKLAEILRPVELLLEELRGKLKDHLDSEGAFLEGHEKVADEILSEKLSLEVPTLTIEELQAPELTVPDESILLFLMGTGVLCGEG